MKGWGWRLLAAVVVHDGLAQIRDGAEAAQADGLGGDLGKPAFDLIEPESAGGNEVDVKARVPREPAAHGGSFVGGVVIERQMQCQLGWGGRVDAL